MRRVIQSWMLIHPGEGGVLLFPFLLYVLVGAGLGLGRASSDAILITRVGLDKLPHLLLATGPALALISVGYAAFVDRIRSDVFFRRLLIVFAFYVGVVAAVMGATDGIPAAALYVLGYMIISEILIVHLNHYALSFFDPIQGRRLFPIIMAGARIGGISGGAAMGLCSSIVPVEVMAWAWAAMLLAPAGLILAHHRRGTPPPLPGAPCRGGRRPLANVIDSWRFARSSRLLQATGVGLVLLVILVSIQDYLTGALFAAHFDDEARLAAFLGWFVAGVNALTLLMQLLLTNRLLSRFGIKAVNLIFPLTSLASFAALVAAPGLFTAIVGRLNGQSALPAFRHPAANLFYHAFPARLQGRARAFVAGTMLPIGFAASGAILLLVPADRVVDVLTWAGLVCVVLLIVNDLIKNRHYGESLMSVVRDLVFLGHGGQVDAAVRLDPVVIRRIGELLRDAHDPSFSESCVEILAHGAPDDAAAVVNAVEAGLSDAVKDRILHLLSRLNTPGWQDLARRWLISGDTHLRTTSLRLLVGRGGDPCRGVVDDWLASPLPRLNAAATEAALTDPDSGRRERGEATLAALLGSSDVGRVVAGLSVAERIGGACLGAVTGFLENEDARVRACAVRCLATARRDDAGSLPAADDLAERAFGDQAAAVRVAGIRALPLIPGLERRLSLLARALGDADADVRRAAERAASDCLPKQPGALRDALIGVAGDFSVEAVLLRAVVEWPLPQRSAILREIAGFHVDCAARKQDKTRRLRHAVRNGSIGPVNAHAVFLYEALCEETETHLDLALLAIEGLKTGVAVSVVRAGLGSRDRRLRALAIESLRAFDDDKLVARTRTILERAFELRGAGALSAADPALLTASGAGAGPASPSPEWAELLRWCAEHGGHWLKVCANAMAAAPTTGARHGN